MIVSYRIIKIDQAAETTTVDVIGRLFSSQVLLIRLTSSSVIVIASVKISTASKPILEMCSRPVFVSIPACPKALFMIPSFIF